LPHDLSLLASPSSTDEINVFETFQLNAQVKHYVWSLRSTMDRFLRIEVDVFNSDLELSLKSTDGEEPIEVITKQSGQISARLDANVEYLINLTF
jgi:hypothetical protein